MSKTSNHVGVGIYTLKEAARLLGVSMKVLKYWIGERPDSPPVLKRQFPDEHLLTFSELMELHFVKLFRDENVSFQAIRKAAAAAERKFGTDYPFTVKQFDTDGTNIFATLRSNETDRELIEELKHGQLVFTKLIKPFFKKLDYRGSADLQRFWPLEKAGRIVLDPMRRFGQPIDNQSGISTDAIFQAVQAGGGQDVSVVAKWFDIPSEAVEAAIRFERSLAT